MSTQPSPPTAGREEQIHATEAENRCYREGEYWTFEFGGRICRVREAKGLHCVAHLLRRPGERIAAVELLRVREGDAPGADVAIAPIDSEAARVLVTKRIHGVVKKLAALHPSLAHHLTSCIKTGGACVYVPDPESPIRWSQRPLAAAPDPS